MQSSAILSTTVLTIVIGANSQHSETSAGIRAVVLRTGTTTWRRLTVCMTLRREVAENSILRE